MLHNSGPARPQQAPSSQPESNATRVACSPESSHLSPPPMTALFRLPVFVLFYHRFFKHRRFSRSKPYIPALRLYRLLSRFILPPIFLIILLSLHFRYEYLTYKSILRSTPPRKSTIDRSLEFAPPPAPIPSLYTRHTTPWYKYPDLRPPIQDTLPANRSHHRYIASSASEDVGDGLGHRFLVVNYERTLAHILNLTYVHRVATYGSLSHFRSDSVDRFFNWHRAPGLVTRSSFFHQMCAEPSKRLITNGCAERTVFCNKLKKSNDLVQHLVQIPASVALCLVKERRPGKCTPVFDAFFKRHTKPNTLFYTSNTLCSWRLMWSGQRLTRGWFHHQYWQGERKSRMDPRYVNIAVHARRGDFLNIKRRLVISDDVYARVIRRVVGIVSEEELDDMSVAHEKQMDLRFRVHVYSEGLFQPRTRHPGVRYLARRGFFGIHDVNEYGTRYVSETGTETPDRYWERLLGNHSRIGVDLHVSEDTLQGLEEMIAADVFVGSASGMSVHIVGQLSRGVPLLPGRAPRSADSSRTIEWDPHGDKESGDSDEENPYFDEERFREVWREYRTHVGADETPFGVALGNENKNVGVRGWLRHEG